MDKGMINPWPDVFFYMDSKNFRDFKSRIYGFGIKDNRLYINEEIPSGQDFAFSEDDAEEMFVIVQRSADKLRLCTDSAGFGCLYIYQKDGFWALSNSLYLLANKVGLARLTLNEDMVAHWLCLRSCTPFSIGDTVFQEIRMLPADKAVEISVADGSLSESEQKSLDEVDLMSPEGVARVDRWIHKWTSLIRGLADCGIRIVQDLTGGFDSRVPFALTLASGVDLGKIRVNISDSGEEMALVKRIGDFFGFKPNALLIPYQPIAFEEAENAFKYTLGYLHTSPSNHMVSDLHFRITGYGGEAVRGAWQKPLERFSLSHTKEYGADFRKSALEYLEKIAQVMPVIRGRQPLQDLYRLSRMRWHFGQDVSCRMLKSSLMLSPLADPLLLSLRQDNAVDYALLFAFILKRIASDLLQFPFISGGMPAEFDTSTLELADWLNAKYPFTPEYRSYPIACAKDRVLDLRLAPAYCDYIKERTRKLGSVGIKKTVQ